MDWQYTPYALPALFAALICAIVVAYVGRHQRQATGSAVFMLLLLAIGEWAFALALEIMAVGVEAKAVWVKAQALGATLAPVSGMLFMAAWTGRAQWLTPRRLALLGLFPAIIFVLALTNEAHHTLWLGELQLAQNGRAPFLLLLPGPAWWAYALFAYALAGLSLMIAITAAHRITRLYRYQTWAVLISGALPAGANLLFGLGLSPLPGFDLTPLGFALSGLLLTLALFRFNLLEVVPVARHIIIENANEAMVLLDTRGRVVDFNPAAQTILSLHPQQAIGRPVAEALAGHPALSALAQTAQTQSIEITVDGPEARCYQAQASPLTNPRGVPLGLLLTLRDVTAYKHVETELRQAETAEREHNRYLQVLNAVTRVTLEAHDFTTLMQTIADQLRELFRADHCFITLWDERHLRPLPTAASGPFRDSYPGYKPKPGEVTLTGTALRLGHTLAIEDALNASEQISRSISTRFDTRGVLAMPLIAGSKKLGAVFIGFRQTHVFTPQELEYAEQAAQQVALAIGQARLWRDVLDEHTRMQAVIEASRDGIILVGADRRVLTINTPALTCLQLPGLPEEWQGRPVRAALQHMRPYAPEMVRLLLDEMRRVRHGNEPPNEGEIEIPPRTLRWFNLPVQTEGSRPGRLLVLHDMTQERQLSTMRDELTHMMVHDLRSPLGTISTALEFLRAETEGLVSSEAEQTLTIAHESTTMTLDLVSAILDVSRLESGKFALDREPVSLAQVCAEATRMQGPALAARNLYFRNAISEFLPPVWIDPALIGRVFQNLLNNAIKFTPAGGIIEFSALMEARQPPQLVVLVSDTGPGIEPNVRDRLFQKFVTGRPAPGQVRRGSGLGLAFCKLVIEAHGGHIWAESTSGRGATFLFTLPIVPEAALAHEEETPVFAYY